MSDADTRKSLNPVAAPFVPKAQGTPTGTPSDKALGGKTKSPAIPHAVRPPRTVGPKVLFPPLPAMMPFGMPPVPMPMPMPPMMPPTMMSQPPSMPMRPRPIIVLMVGDSCTGKTTLSERIAKEQNLMFFCGARVLQSYANQGKSEWEKRALVINAIELMIKDAHAPGCSFRGVIIDRQGKTIDDIYYLNAMLRKNSWNVSAVYCCTVKDDAVLADRMRSVDSALEEHTISERIRASRLLVERCREVYGTPGVWRDIDTSLKEESVARHFRGEIGALIAASVQLPPKMTFYPPPGPPPGESRFLHFVEDVAEYSDVVTKLFRLLQKDRLNKYPGATVGKFLNNENSAAMQTSMTPKDSSYVFRQSREGTPYLFFHTSAEKIYFIPRHLRCVYTSDITMWKKYRLKDFVLEGDLVCDVNGSDVFYVSDCLAAQGKSCLRRDWAERQKYISDCMIPEEDKFAPLAGRLTFLRQIYVDFVGVKDLVRTVNYRGVILQPTGEYHPGTDERLICWYPPQSVFVDLRVRRVELVRDDECTNAVRRLYLDSLSVQGDVAKYVDSGVIVDVSDARAVIAFGNIVEVSMNWLEDRKWTFRRVRYDRANADVKNRVDSASHIPALSAEGFLQFVDHLQSLQDQERKRITYQGDDVVKKLLELKHAPPTKIAEIPCKFYVKGRCRSGDACPYLHTGAVPATALQVSDIENGRRVLQCAECEKSGAGHTDESNNEFYCNACWESYDNAAKSGTERRRRRRAKSKTGTS